jgi:hypothetical protein
MLMDSIVALLCEKPVHNWNYARSAGWRSSATFSPHNPKRRPPILTRLVLKPDTQAVDTGLGLRIQLAMTLIG